MGWGDKKEMIAAENVALTMKNELLEERVAELKEERTELKAQLKHTQEALISKEAPEAYRDKKYAEDQADLDYTMTDAQKENARRQGVRTDTAASWLQNMEDNLFKDPDDMIQQLTRATGTPMNQGGSLHGNEES